jgi:spermidine/putrescine transport system permease protein
MAFFDKLAARRRWLTAVLVAPPALWLFVFLVLPYLALLVQSFLATDEFGRTVYSPTAEHYGRFVAKPVYYGTLIETFKIAGIVTVLCVLLSVPLAYVIAFKVRRYKSLVYTLVIVPLWVSYIVRAYAWKIILGEEGILNSLLLFTGITDKPVSVFLYSTVAVVIGLVHIFTPFVLMPVYTAFEHIPRPLIEASKDLGAGRFTTFFRVVLPLAMPGIIAGATFAFVLTLGDFMAVSLLGGPYDVMMASVVQNLFGTSDDRQLGSAIGIVMLVVVLGILELTARAERRLGGETAKDTRLGGIKG